MLPAFIASKDDAGHFSCGQFVYRSIRARDLLVSGAQFPPQGRCPPHLTSLLLFVHAKHLPQPRLQRCICRTLAASVEPVFKILNLHNMRNLRMPDLHGYGGQSLSYVPDPVVTAQRGEGLGDGFVQGLGGHVDRVRGLVQIVDDDGTGLKPRWQFTIFAICSPLGFLRGDFELASRVPWVFVAEEGKAN